MSSRLTSQPTAVLRKIHHFGNEASKEQTFGIFYDSQQVDAFATHDASPHPLPHSCISQTCLWGSCVSRRSSAWTIRDNEAGHLTIFQDAISSASVTPGACEYEFPYTDATSYLELGTLLEVSSMAFLTGLLLQAELDTSKATLVAVAETESRHNTWSLMDVWRASPFAGPADTVFPHANEILETTNLFIVPGSCPPEDPPYPSPNQKLPLMSNAGNETLEQPGSTISVSFPEKDNQPDFVIGERYYLVAFHGVANASSPFDIKTGTAVFPKDIEPHKGIVVLVIADCPGAPTLESVVAGPLILPQY